MKSPTTTIVLLIVVVLAYLWTSGRIGKVIGAIK
jgi:fatty acid-binding protein DegV